MTNVLDVLPDVSTWRAQDAPENIYAGEGTNMSARARKARTTANPVYATRLLEAGRLVARVMSGNKYAALQFAEAMTTSDFPQLFGDIIDRQMLAAYISMPVSWDQYAKRGRVRDFRSVKRFRMDGGGAVLDTVKERAEYPEAALTDDVYTYAVAKKGRRIGLSWEALVNDDLDAFGAIPTILGQAARRTEEKFATSLYTDSTGPDSTFYSVGNANIVTSNPVLSITALQTAFTVISAQKDTDNNPIYIDMVTLVVPPALEVVARNILNATEILAATGGGDGTGNDQLRVTNWMRNKVQLVVDPWAPIVNTTNGNTAWYLFASPNSGRPAMEVGFLIGHEQPELFQKAPNTLRIGGGTADPLDGDFDTDSVDWKVRHTVGGVLMDPKMSVASEGDGT